AVERAAARGVAARAAVTGRDGRVVRRRPARGGAAGHRAAVGGGRLAPEEPAGPVVGGRGGVGGGGGAVATGDVDGVAAARAAGGAVGVPTVAVERTGGRSVAARPTVTGGDRRVVRGRPARGGAAGHVAGV